MRGLYGSGSSGTDILHFLKNKYEAYVDTSALWKKSGAMLQRYDIAGVLPIALAAGLEVTDIFGNPISDFSKIVQ